MQKRVQIPFWGMVFLSFGALFFVPKSTLAAPAVEYVLDYSASMRERLESQRKISLLQDRVLESLRLVPAGVPVAIRVFGHRVPEQNKGRSCLDSEILLETEDMPTALPALQKRLRALKPRGRTPLAYSLEQSGEDLKRSGVSRPVVLLITDGTDTCGGDPQHVLQQLRDHGIFIRLFTLGIGLPKKEKIFFSSLAEITKGEFVAIEDIDDFDVSLGALQRKALIPFVKGGSRNNSVLWADLGGDHDAGSTIAQALPFSVGVFPASWLGGTDREDRYRISLSPGEKYQVFVKSSQLTELLVSIEQPEGGGYEKLLSEQDHEGGREEDSIQSDVITMSGEAHFLRVRVKSVDERALLSYSLELRQFTSYSSALP